MKRLLILFTFLLTILSVQGYAQGICNDNIDNDGDGLVDCLDHNGGEDCTAKACSELPGNNLDDDGDFFIDCYDKELLINDACDGFFLGKDPCGLPPVNPKPFAMKLKFKSPEQVANHINRLIVGDVDNDGTPEIVTTYRNGNGSAGSATVSTLNFLQAPAVAGSPTLDVTSINMFANGDEATFEDIAMADILPFNAPDGCAEVFVMTTTADGANYKIIAYDCNGTRIWAAPISYTSYPGNMGLADFNGDGHVELYTRTQVYNAETGKLLGENNIDNDNTGINAGVNKGRGMNSNAPIAVDVHPTAGLELVAGCRIYSVAINVPAQTATLTLVRSRPEYGTRTGRTTSSGTSVADFNQDGTLDVVAVGSLNGYDLTTTIFFWDLKTDALKTYTDVTGTGDYTNGWKNGAGRINLADIDGDTLMNAVYVSGKYLYALKEGATGLDLLWRENVTEETSGYTGCTMFDFNADGKSEIVYRDEDYIYIFTTQPDGTVVKSPPVRCASRTSNEYPIVADMDGDGSTEICVACAVDETVLGRNHSLYDAAEVRVYESANDPWVPARRVWNQHGYFVANVNDDLTIPKTQQLHHLVYAENAQCRDGGSSRPLNSFLNQSPFLNSFGCPSFAAPNLAPIMYSPTDTFQVNRPTCPQKNFTVSFKFENRGDIGVSGNMPISFYQGDPRLPGSILLKTMYYPLSNLLPGSNVTVTDEPVVGPGSTFDLYIVINDDGTTNPFVSPNPNAEIKECPGPDNIIFAKIRPQLGPITAVTVRDNTICNVANGFNGAVKAFVPIGAIQDSVNFDFYWFDMTQTPGLASAADDTAHLHTDLGAGDYAVFAVHKQYGCGTVGTFATVVDNTFTLTVSTTSNPNTRCANPFNGSVSAVPGTDGAGKPDSDFIFTWYPSGQLYVGDTLSSAKTMTTLKSNEKFDLGIVHKPTGCTASSVATVLNGIVPVVTGSSHVDINCFETNTGIVEAWADVGGGAKDTTNFKFYWFNGNFSKPSADYSFASYKHRPAGNYTYVVERISSGCKSDTLTETISEKVGPSLVKGPKTNQTSCDAQNPNGTASASVVGSSTYEFFWYNGTNTNSTPINTGITNTATTTLIEGLKPQVYSVKVVDQVTQCAVSDTFKILNRLGPFTLNPASKAMEHCQPLDGEASVIPSVGNPGDYTYSWYAGKNVLVNPSFPVTGNVLTGLAAGFYTVKAVNSNTTCQAPAVTIEVLDNTKSITITVVPDPAAYPTECESEDGTIKATISVAGGNTFGLDVKWFQSDPATTPPVKQDILKQSSMLFGSPVTDMLDQIPSGFYTIVVVNKDDNCESEKEYFLPTIRTDSLNVVPTDKTVCGLPGNGEIEALLVIKPKPVGATPTSKNDYIMELWKDGGATPVATIAGATNANNTFNFTALDTGKYYVYARRADPNRGDICETFSDYYEIKDMIVDPGLELDSVINTNCFDGLNNANGQVIATTSGPAVQSIHFFEGINITDIVNPGPIQTGVSNTLNNLKGGYYTAVFTGTNRCAILSSIFVPADTSFIDANITTLPLTECAPYPPGDIDGSVTIVSLTEEKASGSTTTNSVAGYTVTWFDETGVTTIADPMAPAEVLENRMDGEYYVHLKNNITKCQSPQIVAVVDDLREFPVIELVDFLTPTQCLKVDLPKPNHDPVTQQRVGYLDINVTGTGPLTTTWTSSEIPPAVIMGDDVQGITTAGTFSVTVRNTNTTCSTTEQYVIPIERVPVVISASAVPLLSCINPDGQLSAIVTSADSLKTGRYTDYMYLWYFGQTDTTAIAHKQRVINDAIDTVYTLVVRDRVDASCEAQAFIEVEDGRIFPVVTAGMLKPLSVCDTTKAPADGMGYAEVDGNTIDYNFEWTGEPPQVNDIFDKDPIAEGLRTGIIYTVRASNKVTGCPGTAEVSVEFVPPPISPPNIVLLSDVTKCDVLDDYPQGPNTTDPDGALSVSVGGNVTDYIFDWYNPGDLINIAYTGIQYDTLPPGEYTVIATDRRTFCTATAKETVGFKPAYPEFVIETLPTVCELTTGSIYLTVTNNIEISDIVWEWTGDADGDGTAENFPIPNYETGPVVQEAQSGVYNVVVSTPQGCWQNGSALIKTEINPFNGISRNGDNMNSYFHINCIENFPFNIVKIYNRAGTLVFEGKNYDNNTVLFNGESNKGISIMGTNLPDGTYFYVIDKHDGSKPLAGYLEIVK